MELEFPELALMAEQLETGIVVCNNDGTIEFANPFASRFFAFGINEIIGKKVSDLSPSFKFNPDKMNNDKVELHNISIKNKFGRAIFFNATIVRGLSRERLIVTIEDITTNVEKHQSLLNKVNTLEALTKSRYMREGLLTKSIHEILKESAKALNVERVNAWRNDKDFTMIECIGNYNLKEDSFEKNIILLRNDMPAYFKLLSTQEIIATNNSLEDPRTEELVESYLNKFGITSMIDVPIRIEGEMIGVVCFENVGVPRVWDLVERKFCLFISQLISISLETYERQQLNLKLEKTLKEKALLLKELGREE